MTHADRIDEALKILKEEKFDVVLLDLNLPDSQGLDGIERITAQEPEVPVIILTGLDDETLGIQAVRKHAGDYLVKGQINSNILVRSIRYAIERKQMEEQIRKLNRTLRALSQSNQVLMRATEESAYLQDVCRIIIEDCGYAMVWIGYAEEDEAKNVRPVAHAGFEKTIWKRSGSAGPTPNAAAAPRAQPYAPKNRPSARTCSRIPGLSPGGRRPSSAGMLLPLRCLSCPVRMF